MHQPVSLPSLDPIAKEGVPIPILADRSGSVSAPVLTPAHRGVFPISLDSLIGRTLNGRYQVQRKIGEGGFGAVFEGIQVATGRLVALKILLPHSMTDNTIVARFRREAEACSKLRNPHTVVIYDFDQTEDGVLYLAMELVQGISLQAFKRSQRELSPARCLQILAQVAEALGEAHALGIVHRDMKPENIMVEERENGDYVKVLDFGIAKIISGDSLREAPVLTAVGQTVGTLEFMSPEQLRGKPLDGRSDIYALGMVAYEILTGELPFKGAKSPMEVIQFHLHAPPPAPSAIRFDAGINLAVDELIQKMVAKHPEDRHANAEDLREHIDAALQSLEKSLWSREVKRLGILLGFIVLVVATVVYFWRR
jgi:serine/threonine-protein kinase